MDKKTVILIYIVWLITAASAAPFKTDITPMPAMSYCYDCFDCEYINLPLQQISTQYRCGISLPGIITGQISKHCAFSQNKSVKITTWSINSSDKLILLI